MCPEWEVLTVAVSGCSPGLPASEMHSLEGAAYQNSQLSSPGVCCLGWRYTHTHTMPLWPRWFPLLGMSASMESQRLLCPRLLQQFRYFCLTGEELRLLKRQEKRDGQRGSPRARVCTQASGSHSRLFSLPTSLSGKHAFLLPFMRHLLWAAHLHFQNLMRLSMNLEGL